MSKKRKIDYWFIGFIMLDILFTIWVLAQIHYIRACYAVKDTDGSDLAIERTMAEHGFAVDANDTVPPDLWEKLKALVIEKPDYEKDTIFVKEGFPVR